MERRIVSESFVKDFYHPDTEQLKRRDAFLAGYKETVIERKPDGTVVVEIEKVGNNGNI
jgi:hypothetical protein